MDRGGPGLREAAHEGAGLHLNLLRRLREAPGSPAAPQTPPERGTPCSPFCLIPAAEPWRPLRATCPWRLGESLWAEPGGRSHAGHSRREASWQADVPPPSPPSPPPRLGATGKDPDLGHAQPQSAEELRRGPSGPGQRLGKATPHAQPRGGLGDSRRQDTGCGPAPALGQLVELPDSSL